MEIIDYGSVSFQLKVAPGYKVRTKLALQWKKLSSGNYVATDRGSDEDVYEADISTIGTESYINNIITQINTSRLAGTTLSATASWLSSDYIFGENIDYAYAYEIEILSMSERRQIGWKSFQLDLTLRLKSAMVFQGSSSFPTLKWCDIGAGADADMTIRKQDSYTGIMSSFDHRSDTGIFEGVFTLTNADFILLRNYIKNQRSGNFSLADTFGVAYPFGNRTSNSYPYSCKLIDWEDLGWFGLKYNRIKLTFAENV